MADGPWFEKVVILTCTALGLIAAFLTLSNRLPTRIESFHPSASFVWSGDHLTVTWRVKGYRSRVFLDGLLVPNEGARDFMIDRPRTFVLTARGAFGEDRKLVEISIIKSSPPLDRSIKPAPYDVPNSLPTRRTRPAAVVLSF